MKLSEPAKENSSGKLLLQGQNAECKAKFNNKLHLLSKISKNIHEYNKKIKTKKNASSVVNVFKK